MIRILIADDHPIVRQGFKTVLEREKDLRVAGEAGAGPEVIEKLRSAPYEVLVLDLSLPGMSGLEVLKQARGEGIKVPTLILSAYAEEQYAVRALRAGAAGYLTKEVAKEELVKAVRTIASGKKYITTTVAEKLAGLIQRDADRPAHELLSDREFEVLRRVASGRTPGEIAQELHLSVSTVSTYRSRILDKLDLRTSAELTYYALVHGLVD